MAYISKEEAINNHRMMWNWIADETLKRKECVGKEDAFRNFGWKPYEIQVKHDCWCCQRAWMERAEIELYDCDNVLHNKCYYCPIKWPGGKCVDMDSIFPFLYERWVYAYAHNRYKKASKLARKIANLPERKD